jgi:hypothetical protein
VCTAGAQRVIQVLGRVGRLVSLAWRSQPDAEVIAGDVQADGDADVDVVVLDAALAARDLPDALLADVGCLGDRRPAPPPLVQEPEHGADVAACQCVAHGYAVNGPVGPPCRFDRRAHWHLNPGGEDFGGRSALILTDRHHMVSIRNRPHLRKFRAPD